MKCTIVLPREEGPATIMTPIEQKIDESLVRKIQLLMNLGSRSEGNESEAAAAMAKAQELLTRYNLDLATVEGTIVAGGAAAREAETKRDYAKSQRNATYDWTRRLMKALAEANYCEYWAQDEHYETKSGNSKRRKRHKVLGRVANTTGVLVMFDYLYQTIMRLLPYDKSTWLSSDAMAWCDGCVDRLCERIAAKAEDMRKADYTTQGETAYCTAIQVADMAQKETIANYDFRNGIGAWAKKLARQAESDAYWTTEAMAARQAKADERLAAKRALESPADRAKRERAEAAQKRKNDAWRARYWDREERKAEREEARKASGAYRSGLYTGNGIGLDSQVTGGAERKEIA